MTIDHIVCLGLLVRDLRDGVSLSAILNARPEDFDRRGCSEAYHRLTGRWSDEYLDENDEWDPGPTWLLVMEDTCAALARIARPGKRLFPRPPAAVLRWLTQGEVVCKST